MREERRRGPTSPTPPQSVEIRAFGESQYVHFPAGEDDVREVLGRLPRGVLDGLAGVTLHPGWETQSETAARDPGGEEADPFIGRLGFNRFPGVWSGRILGRYRPGAAEIELHAYVYDPADPWRHVWEPLLRLEALSVLAHEVAHHHDHATRTGRGRWRADRRETNERYAERMQHQWTHGVVLPYLRERYAVEVALLERWIERHGGIAIPLETLADDPRTTERGGRENVSRLLWKPSAAIDQLLCAVREGEPLWRCRLAFALELYYLDLSDEALAVLERVLRERPGEPEALARKANVLIQLGRHGEALSLADALEAGDDLVNAWTVRMRVAEALERWPEMAEAATRLMEEAEAAGSAMRARQMRFRRAKAFLRAGDLAGAREDVERLLASDTGFMRKGIESLRAEIERAASPNQPDPKAGRGRWKKDGDG